MLREATPTPVPTTAPAPTHTPESIDFAAELDLVIAMVSEMHERVISDPAYQSDEADLLDCMNKPHADGTRPPKTFVSLDDILEHYTEPVFTRMEEAGDCSTQADALFDTNENLSRMKLTELRSENPEYDALLSTEIGKEFLNSAGDRYIIMLYAKLSAPDTVEASAPSAAQSEAPAAIATPTGPYLTIGGTVFGAEIADTPELRSKGLGERDALADQTGMLFIFPDGGASSFWMKGMRFPLDFVWIGEDCTVVDLTENVQHSPPDTPSSELEIFESGEPAAYTLEINAGEVQEFGIEVGDEVLFHNIESEFAGCCESGECGGE